MSDEARPFSKERQLARGIPRYARKVASRKRWQAIIDAKMEPCRICKHEYRGGNGGFKAQHAILDPHHLVARIDGGDDLEDNIVMLCRTHHDAVTLASATALASLGAALTSSERGYVLRKLGPDGYARVFGVTPA